jgi:hypothetical protein
MDAGECVGRRPAGCEERADGVGGCGEMEDGCVGWRVVVGNVRFQLMGGEP